jgi:hypothetical protein
MKTILNSSYIVLLVIAGLYIVFLRECRKPTINISTDEIAIKKSVWDSIQNIAKRPPVIRRDTFYVKGKTVFVPVQVPVPVQDKKDSTIYHYEDSLVNKEIDIHTSLSVRGTILARSWSYVPITTKIVIEKDIFVPQIVNNPIPIPKNGLYGYALVGGNSNLFIPGVGLDLITKKNTMIGAMYQRFGSENIYTAKLGIKFGK